MEYLICSATNGMCVLKLDSSTVAHFLEEGNRRVICTLEDNLSIHCAIMRTKEEGYFVYVGNSILTKLGLRPGNFVHAIFRKDETPYQFDVPEEFLEVLRTDPEAYEVFNSLTPGNQRGLIYLIQRLKTSDKRIERALLIAQRIKAGVVSPRSILK